VSPRPNPRIDEVTEEQVAAWVTALQSSTGLLGASFKLKRWTPKELALLEVGFDGDRYTFPTRDHGGALEGLVRYAPAAILGNGQPKSIAATGSKRNLYPAPETLEGDVAACPIRARKPATRRTRNEAGV
jgi:hypothetical protein